MKKFFKYLFKTLGVGICVTITIILVLFVLNIWNVTNIRLQFLEEIPYWHHVTDLQSSHPRSFTLLITGIALFAVYGSVLLALSLIPVVGKVVGKIIKIFAGWIFTLGGVILITFGALGISDVITFIG